MIGRSLADLEAREDWKNKAVNTVATIIYTVHRKLQTASDSAVYAEQEAGNIIKDAHGKTEGVKIYIMGCHAIPQDSHKIAGHISNNLISL